MNRVLAIRLGRWLLFVGPAAGLFVLELLHPNPHALGTVYQSVSPVVDWWIELHVLLVVLFALLAFAVLVSLAGEHHATATTARLALGAFVAGTAAFVGTEGIGMGLVIRGAQGVPAAQQAGVDQAVQALWDSPTANLLGAFGQNLLWVLAIGASAAALYPSARRPLPLALLGLALLWAIAFRVLPVGLPLATGVNVVLWVAIVTVVATEARTATVPFGLLLLAAMLPQHGDPPGAVGVACLGLALAWREFRTQRSAARAPLLATPATASVN